MPTYREPINLVLLKGKSHKTKEEIEMRREMEVQAPSDDVRYPKYLPKELRADYNKISKRLVECGIFSNLDVDLLARFLIARDEYVRITEQLREINPREDIVYYERVLKVHDKLFNQTQRCSAELGLSITSRGKLLVPNLKKGKETKEEQLSRKFGV